jgi:excisionase family DNA binding protein
MDNRETDNTDRRRIEMDIQMRMSELIALLAAERKMTVKELVTEAISEYVDKGKDLRAKVTPVMDNTKDERYLTVAEAAVYARVGRVVIDDAIEDKEISYVVHGRRTKRIKLSDLRKWIASRTIHGAI